jgi:hypothetical protein
MKCLKKAMVSCVLMATIITTPARSMVGVSFAAPGAVVAGVAILAVGAVGGYGSYRLIKSGKTGLGIAAAVVSAAGGYLGFIILDGKQEAKFAEISADAASELGVSEAEREIYNSEIEQVNAIAREIGSELVNQNSDSVEAARDMWMDLGTELSPETMKTVIAIAQQG